MKGSRSLTSFCFAIVLSLGTANTPGQAKVIDWSEVGRSKNNSGDYQGAIIACNEALRKRPHQAKALRVRAMSLKNVGLSEQALKDIDQAIKFDSAEAYNYSIKGYVLESLSRTEEAVAAYKKALELDGKGSQYYEDLTSALIHLGGFEEGLLWSERAVRKMPGSAGLHVIKSHMLYALDKLESAWIEIDLASSMGDFSSYMYDIRARILSKKGEDVAAIACLKAALAVYPNDAFLHCQLSDLYLNNQRIQEAKKESELAIMLDPATGYPQACRVLSTVDAQQALVFAEQSVRLNPFDGGQFEQRGSLKERTGDYAGAVRDFDMAIKLEPWNYRPHQCKALSLDYERRFDEAIKEYKRAEDLGADPYYSSASIAYILMLQKRWEDAEAYLDRAIKNTCNRPSRAGLYSSRAGCRSELGKYESANQDYALSYKMERNSRTMECWRRALLERRDYCGYLGTFITEYTSRS